MLVRRAETRSIAPITVTSGTGCAPEGLHAAVTAMMRTAHIPGLSLAVASRDRLIFSAGFGEADIADAAAATSATAYLWFSMSKIVTATAVLRLVQEGGLDLDAPAGEYVACLRAPGPLQPTVRHLLNHSSGLANPLPLRWIHRADTPSPDTAALLECLMRRRRAYRHPPGRTAHYSNVGYLALGQIVAVVTGTTFEHYAQQAVLEPIGMRTTGYSYPAAIQAATGYVRAPRLADPVLRQLLPDGVTGPRAGRYLALNRFYVDGPAYGGLIGDVVDAARFLRMHLGRGEIDGQWVLAPGTARRMRTIDRSGPRFDHGLGWFRRPSGGHADWVEHFGAGAGFWNVMRLYPERDRGVVIMTNSTTTYDFEPLMALLAGAP